MNGGGMLIVSSTMPMIAHKQTPSARWQKKKRHAKSIKCRQNNKQRLCAEKWQCASMFQFEMNFVSLIRRSNGANKHGAQSRSASPWSQRNVLPSLKSLYAHLVVLFCCSSCLYKYISYFRFSLWISMFFSVLASVERGFSSKLCAAFICVIFKPPSVYTLHTCL